jgi:hypothetical protein
VKNFFAPGENNKKGKCEKFTQLFGILKLNPCGGCMESKFNDISGCHHKYTGVSMTSKRLSRLGCLAVFILILLIWGCASDPVEADLPANHPANPEAAEVPYTMVPNPFKNADLMIEMKITGGHSMPHQGREDSPAPIMKPMSDKDPKDPEKSGQQHQEHK